MKPKHSCFLLLMAVVGLFGASAMARADYSGEPAVQLFIDKMVQEQQFTKAELEGIFAQAAKQQAILDAIARPAEKTKSWAEYRPIFLKPARIKDGVAFWQDNEQALADAEQVYGVPAEYIVAIIGVETLYGRVTGRYRVIDALSTLAFDYPPRSPFFTRELEAYLIMCREHKIDPLQIKGSYAGAMGLGQFMPSSYREYAVDYSGDGWPDIWNNQGDAVASVANYFKRHGWQRGGTVAVRARPSKAVAIDDKKSIAKPEKHLSDWLTLGLSPVTPLAATTPLNVLELQGVFGEEYWFTANNFYVITRYNRSALYALAVHQLAQEILTEKMNRDK